MVVWVHFSEFRDETRKYNKIRGGWEGDPKWNLDFRFPEQAISEKCIMVMCGQSSNHYLETDILSFEPVDCQRKLCGLYTIW